MMQRDIEVKAATATQRDAEGGAPEMRETSPR